ncbi:MAG TPA: flagellar basal body P-ring formation chaperone FlgA [Stellaceae bacterium]|nr:flagellar basal body P-ring formation chaperone FlgA [Stellaceae bacterium]
MIRNLRTLLFAAGMVTGAAASAATPVPEAPATVLAHRLDAALESRGVAGPHQVELDNPMLTLPKGLSLDSVRLDNMSIDSRNGRLIALFSGADGKPQLRVTGRFYQLIDVMVPARAIEPGEVIAERDLQHATVRRDPAAQEPLTDAAALVGKTPRHVLREGQPVSAAELEAPLVIHRGELVTMVLETPLMRVSAQGQAMEDAARGAAIRVTNTKSHRVVEATATGPGTVSVTFPTAQ